MPESFKDSALHEILSSHDRAPGSLVPVLQEIQERYGYLPQEALDQVARHLRVDEATVFSVATFYAQFKLVPAGKHQVKVCLGTACHVRGGPLILQATERALDIPSGGVTRDRQFGLERVACFGSCALAPVMVIDKEVYGRMTISRVKQILEEAKKRGEGEE